MHDQALGRNFWLAEFCTSNTATRAGINMAPPDHVVNNLRNLVHYVIEPLRDILKRPIVISSGYRPPALNTLVGGARASQHVSGQAADLIVPGLRPIDVCQAIVRADLPFDQLIFEFGDWTHVSYSSTKRRGNILTAKRNGRSVIYSNGLTP